MFFRLSGRLFQSLGAALLKALGPDRFLLVSFGIGSESSDESVVTRTLQTRVFVHQVPRQTAVQRAVKRRAHASRRCCCCCHFEKQKPKPESSHTETAYKPLPKLVGKRSRRH
jgi:hypothetical protein